jgi:hypothetical protein
VKRTGRDEPLGVVIHICMERQGHSLCSYLYLKLAKMSCFSYFKFFFYKIREQEDRTGSALGEGGTGGREEVVGKGYEGEYSANNVYTCT